MFAAIAMVSLLGLGFAFVYSGRRWGCPSQEELERSRSHEEVRDRFADEGLRLEQSRLPQSLFAGHAEYRGARIYRAIYNGASRWVVVCRQRCRSSFAAAPAYLPVATEPRQMNRQISLAGNNLVFTFADSRGACLARVAQSGRSGPRRPRYRSRFARVAATSSRSTRVEQTEPLRCALPPDGRARPNVSPRRPHMRLLSVAGQPGHSPRGETYRFACRRTRKHGLRAWATGSTAQRALAVSAFERARVLPRGARQGRCPSPRSALSCVRASARRRN